MAELLKNQFFQREFINGLADQIAQQDSHFSTSDFKAQIFNSDWENAALKQRMQHISQAIHKTLNKDYESALGILTKIAHQFRGFNGMIFPDFVEQFGLNNPNLSLAGLQLFTQFSSSEFAIRPFIIQHQSMTMAKMVDWSQHSNQHLRRLSSEGCRPRLPWAMALTAFKDDPNPILPILENLKSDRSEYVRKSVANNLNDIGKDNPLTLIDTARKWNQNPSDRTRWIIKQGLRSLVKSGQPEALQILGYTAPQVGLQNLSLSPNPLLFGSDLSIRFELTNQKKQHQQLLIDYLIHFVKANGKTAPKVFKLSTVDLGPLETTVINKKHPIKPIRTRKYYPGRNRVEIQVNGQVLASNSFELIMSPA